MSVRGGDGEEVRAFEAVAFTRDLETEDGFGRLQSGTLTLRGYLQRDLTYKESMLRNENDEKVGAVFPDFEDSEPTQILYLPVGAHRHVAYCLML